MQQYYITSAQELARLVGVCKAPVIQHLAETISGSPTIRSFDEESRFKDENMRLTDAILGLSSIMPVQGNGCASAWICCLLSHLPSPWFS